MYCKKTKTILQTCWELRNPLWNTCCFLAGNWKPVANQVEFMHQFGLNEAFGKFDTVVQYGAQFTVMEVAHWVKTPKKFFDSSTFYERTHASHAS